MNTRLPRLLTLPSVLAASFLVSTQEAHATLLTYWNFNNTSPAYQTSGGVLGSFKTSAASPTDFGEIYTQTNNSTPGTLSSNTSNSTVFNGGAIKIDFSNIGTIAGLPNGPKKKKKKGPGYTTQESTIGYAGYGSFAGSTTNAVGSDAAGDSLIFLNGANSINTKYITFSLSSLGYDTLSFSYGTRLSMTADEIWTYSTDGTTFNTLTTKSFTTTSGSFVSTVLDLSTLSSNALNNQSAFYLRMAFNSGAGSGSYAFDNFQLNGTATAVPEPSTYALLGGVAALGLALGSRRKRA